MIEDIKFLKDSLIFQMSLGSKELFHSNVWAWLMEQDHNFIKVFFKDIDLDKYDIVGIDREKYHRDLIIWLNKKGSNKEKTDYLIIENKIKSLPREEQLEDYSKEKLDKCELLGAVITGLDDYLDKKAFNNGIEWKFVSYDEIANGIEDKLSQTKIGKKVQIKEYCEVIRAIERVIGGELNRLGDSLLVDQWDEKYKDLNELRIDDLLKKANGAKFKKLLETHREDLERDIPDEYKPMIIRQGFHNNKVTMDIFYSNENKDKSNDFFFIGVQTEGKQYRHVACKKQGHNKVDLFKDMTEKGWFDGNYSKENRVVFGHKSSMDSKDKFNSYNPNAFVYQHYELNESNSSFEELYQNIKKDMDKAKEIFKKIR